MIIFIMNIIESFPPSEPCSCEICTKYCQRPGWWTIEEFERVLESQYYHRVMLEVAPELTFSVLSPAFKGCESNFALQDYAKNGCNFFINGLCELFGTNVQPLECRYCHHERAGKGIECHTAIENEWNSHEGKKLVEVWIDKVRFPYIDYYKSIMKKP